MRYDPSAWFWFIGGDTSKLWSSAKPGYVQSAGPEYSAFMLAGGSASSISSMDDLKDLFAKEYPGGTLATYAAYARWRKEVGGISVGEVQVATDDRSKQMILGARVAAASDPEFTTPWVSGDGSITTLNAEQIISMSDAVLAHVQSCFTSYASVVSGISGGAITTRAQIDEAFS